MVNELGEDCFDDFYRTFGRPSYHPKMLLSALLFAYTQGVFSGRKIEKLMVENLAMRYLTGQLVVSYRTINRFRVAKGMEDLIRDLCIELTLRFKMEDLVSLECLFIDGTKIEANANKYSFVWKRPRISFPPNFLKAFVTHAVRMKTFSSSFCARTSILKRFLFKSIFCLASFSK